MKRRALHGIEHASYNIFQERSEIALSQLVCASLRHILCHQESIDL